LPDALVIASDIDRVAVDVAEANVAINGLEGRIECLEAAGLHHRRIQAAGPYDLIFANILKGPLIELAPESAQVWQPVEERFYRVCSQCRQKRSRRPMSRRGFVC
jgi:ribosomal protein L11 methyltransferase